MKIGHVEGYPRFDASTLRLFDFSPGLGALVACLLLAGCYCPDAFEEAAAEAPAVVLPEDEAPHCSAAEWWYYTGLLTAEDGREYGFETVIFHAAPSIYAATPTGLPLYVPVDGHVAHVSITDVADANFAYDQIRILQPQRNRSSQTALT